MSVSRILFPEKIGVAVIYLAPALLPVSSGLPEGNEERTTLSAPKCRTLLLDLAPGGVCHDPAKGGTPPKGTPCITA